MKKYFILLNSAVLFGLAGLSGCDSVQKQQYQQKQPLGVYQLSYNKDARTLQVKSIGVTPPRAGINITGLAGVYQPANALFDGTAVTAPVFITNNDTKDWTGVEMQAYSLTSGSATVCGADLGTGWSIDSPAEGAWGWIFTSGTTGTEFTIPANGGQSVDKAIGFNATADFIALVYIYANVPVITGTSSATGLTGDTLTIAGYNFSTTQGAVTFNGITASVQSWTDTSVTVTVPANTTLGNILVDSGDPNTPYSNPSLFTPYSVFSNDPLFATPIGITEDTIGNLYIADFTKNEILKSDTSAVISVYSSDPLLSSPADVALATDGTLYVVNNADSNIIAINVTGTASLFSTAGASPAALAFSSEGQSWPLFVANSGAGTITSITSNGTAAQFASGFASPNTIATDSSGNVYVGDCGNGTVYEINAAGTVTTTIISTLVCPAAIKFDTNGTMYVLDSGTAAIYKYNPNIVCGNNVSFFAQDINTNGDAEFVFSPDYSKIYMTQDSPVAGIILIPLK